MGIFLDEKELARTEGAENAAFRTPVPTRVVSNGEFTPIPQTEQQKKVEARIGELADRYGVRRASTGAASSSPAAAWRPRSSP
jgi:uncharacterized protein